MAGSVDKKSAPLDENLDFTEEDHLLHYRPRIEWEEPPDEYLTDTSTKPASTDIETTRQKTEALINGYKRVNQIIDLVKKKIDSRVKAQGGLDVKLDSLQDQATIAAIKRKFPDKDASKITYDMYKDALACMNKASLSPLAVTSADIKAAKADPTTTSFGGYGSQPGALRAEISNPMAMKPVDLKDFQKKAVVSLFKLMEPMVTANSKGQVAAHEKTKKHG